MSSCLLLHEQDGAETWVTLYNSDYFLGNIPLEGSIHADF